MRILRPLLIASFFYVIIRIIFGATQVLNRHLFATINYHYSDELLWYVIWFILPLTLGVLFGIFIRNKFIERIGYILFPLLIVFTIIGSYKNYQYWGYFFKRPSVFQELKQATDLFTITDISKAYNEDNFIILNDTIQKDNLYGREDLYYGNMDRPIMTFLDRANFHSNFYDWYKIANDPSKKIDNQKLNKLISEIYESKILLTPEKGYNERGNRFTGKIIQFKTERNINYLHVSLQSGEVSNDHYPYYEFLLMNSNSPQLIKKQKYFTDFAGIEGIEFSNVAPIIEALFLVLSTLISLAITGIHYFIKRKAKFKSPLQTRFLTKSQNPTNHPKT